MKTAVLFGDSITAGVYVQEDERYMADLEKDFPDIQFLNKGVPGNTSSDGRARFQTDVLDNKPDICVIFFGMNDTVCDAGVNMPKVDAAQYENNLQYFIGELKAIGCAVILCTIYPIIEGNDHEYYYSRHPRANYQNPPGVNAWLAAYSDIVRKTAIERETMLADVSVSFQAYVSEGGKPEDLLVTLEDYGVDDGVHPNPKGHRRIAHVISRLMRVWQLELGSPRE